MAGNEWSEMGCGDAASEFDCVMALGQEQANTVFKKHWDSWITADDFKLMASWGINTVRIPVGYWIYEDLVDDSEHFPQGGLESLKTYCKNAADNNIYVIMDLHGGPGAQTAGNAFTGQNADVTGFFENYNYDRAIEWHKRMTKEIHSDPDTFKTVGMIELINEPETGHDTLVSYYYPNAFNAIRQVEAEMNIPSEKQLNIQMMDENWGAGDPDSYLNSTTGASYDNHRYLKWDTSVELTHDAFISTSCGDDPASDGDTPVIVGEMSLGVPDEVEQSPDWVPQGNEEFYGQWFSAQIHTYEKQMGWIYWSWKTDLDDYRWDYKKGVEAGVISRNPTGANSTICG